jgi:hypothetical protein
MAVTNQRGVYEFRELLHGQYNNNSKLEENAVRMMPRGVAWKIVYTKFGIAGGGRTRQGRRHKVCVRELKNLPHQR